MVADLWQGKRRITGCFKNRTSVILQQCQNKVSLQRKDSSIVSKFLRNLLKGLQHFLVLRDNFLPFKCCENFNTMPKTLSLKIYFILTLLENDRSAVLKQPLILTLTIGRFTCLRKGGLVSWEF